MAIRTSKLVFYHIPKTGGIWVKRALENAGVWYKMCKPMKAFNKGLPAEHTMPQSVYPRDVAGLFSFTFVRNPIDWYKSYWSYRVQKPDLFAFPTETYSIESHMNSNFSDFVNTTLAANPNGAVTQLYKDYIGEFKDKVDFVGKQENLADDLVTALTLAGEEFNEFALRNTESENVASGLAEYSDLCILDSSTEASVLENERWIIDNFYK